MNRWVRYLPHCGEGVTLVVPTQVRPQAREDRYSCDCPLAKRATISEPRMIAP